MSDTSKLVKYWVPGEIDEVLMLVNGDPGDPDVLVIAGAALSFGASGAMLKVNWEIVIDNIEAPVTFALDHNRPYLG